MGRILGPPFCLLFINDIPSNVSSKLYCFVEDTTTLILQEKQHQIPSLRLTVPAVFMYVSMKLVRNCQEHFTDIKKIISIKQEKTHFVVSYP